MPLAAGHGSASRCRWQRMWPRSGSLSRILIVDDDPDLLSACTVGLTALGHQVWTAHTGAEGLDQAAIRAPEVIVLDLGLPDLDGLEVCKRIRTWSDVPVIVLSADGSEDRKVDALEHGADDYMTKPFGMRELHARVQVALRHRRLEDADPERPADLDVGPLHLDLLHRQATFHGGPLDLTPKELDFLAFLARNPGKVCTRRMLMENVWGTGYGSESHYLKVYAYRIRRKLGDEQDQFLQRSVTASRRASDQPWRRASRYPRRVS